MRSTFSSPFLFHFIFYAGWMILFHSLPFRCRTPFYCCCYSCLFFLLKLWFWVPYFVSNSIYFRLQCGWWEGEKGEKMRQNNWSLKKWKMEPNPLPCNAPINFREVLHYCSRFKIDTRVFEMSWRSIIRKLYVWKVVPYMIKIGLKSWVN